MRDRRSSLVDHHDVWLRCSFLWCWYHSWRHIDEGLFIGVNSEASLIFLRLNLTKLLQNGAHLAYSRIAAEDFILRGCPREEVNTWLQVARCAWSIGTCVSFAIVWLPSYVSNGLLLVKKKHLKLLVTPSELLLSTVAFTTFNTSPLA